MRGNLTCQTIINGIFSVFYVQAWKKGFVYPRYTYITIGWYNEHWWTSSNPISCTTEQMEATLEYSLAIAQRPVTKNKQEPTYPTGIVSSKSIDFYYVVM